VLRQVSFFDKFHEKRYLELFPDIVFENFSPKTISWRFVRYRKPVAACSEVRPGDEEHGCEFIPNHGLLPPQDNFRRHNYPKSLKMNLKG